MRYKLTPKVDKMGEDSLLAIKDEGRKRSIENFFLYKDTEKMKKVLVHNNPNIRVTSVRLYVDLALIFGFRLLTTDVTYVYLRTVGKVMKDV